MSGSDGLRELTAAQLGIWHAQQLDRANPGYNTGEYLEFRGELDSELFHRALRLTIDEAGTYATRFVLAGDEPRQHSDPAGWPLHHIDVSEAPDPRAAAEGIVIGVHGGVGRPARRAHSGATSPGCRGSRGIARSTWRATGSTPVPPPMTPGQRRSCPSCAQL